MNDSISNKFFKCEITFLMRDKKNNLKLDETNEMSIELTFLA